MPKGVIVPSDDDKRKRVKVGRIDIEAIEKEFGGGETLAETLKKRRAETIKKRKAKVSVKPLGDSVLGDGVGVVEVTMKDGKAVATIKPIAKVETKRTKKVRIEIREHFSQLELLGYYLDDPSFQKLLETDHFVFVDGYVCLNRPWHFYTDENGIHIKRELIKEYSSCVLIRQLITHEDGNIKETSFIAPDLKRYRDVINTSKSKLFADIVEDREYLANSADMGDFMFQGPTPPFPTYGAALEFYMNEDKRKWSVHDLDDLTGISYRSIDNYLKEKAVPEIKYAVAICLALVLYYIPSLKMIRLTKHVLDDITREERAYHFLLQQNPVPSVAEANSMLMQYDLDTLTGKLTEK